MIPEIGVAVIREVILEEVLGVLQKVQTGSLPGEDGLPWEFWKKFKAEFES